MTGRSVHPMPDDKNIKEEKPIVDKNRNCILGLVIAIIVIFALAGIAGVVAWTLLRKVSTNPLSFPATLVPKIEISKVEVSDIVNLLTVPNLIVKSPFATAADNG